jgi:hypothetical protein
MYACILEPKRGFFEGGCTPCNATAHFSDPLPLIRESSTTGASRDKGERGYRSSSICPFALAYCLCTAAKSSAALRGHGELAP